MKSASVFFYCRTGALIFYDFTMSVIEQGGVIERVRIRGGSPGQ
jgi:hypothetical protein